MENKTKVVFCLFAAAVADPLGAGAVGDGCELKKVFYLSFFINCFCQPIFLDALASLGSMLESQSLIN